METLVEKFNQFFIKKVEKIRENMTQRTNMGDHFIGNRFDSIPLSEFEPTSLDEIEDILQESAFKCSPSDILPTGLFKDNLSIFKETLVQLVNLSLSEGNVDGVKRADIIPNLKDDLLDNNFLKIIDQYLTSFSWEN